MIRNEAEYKEALERLKAENERLQINRLQLQNKGLNADEIEAVMEPLFSFHAHLIEDVDIYERAKRGQFWDLVNLGDIGKLLIAIRIATGMTQRDLADKLGVSETQVSRDEKNEYHAATTTRINRILEAFGAELHSAVKIANKGNESLDEQRDACVAEQKIVPIRLRTTPFQVAAAVFVPPDNEQLIGGVK